MTKACRHFIYFTLACTPFSFHGQLSVDTRMYTLASVFQIKSHFDRGLGSRTLIINTQIQISDMVIILSQDLICHSLRPCNTTNLDRQQRAASWELARVISIRPNLAAVLNRSCKMTCSKNVGLLIALIHCE